MTGADAQWLDELARRLRRAQEALGSTELTPDQVITRLKTAEEALGYEIKRRRRS